MLNRLNRNVIVIYLLCSALFVSSCVFSPLVTGELNGDIFTNEWTNITFELPAGFRSASRDEFDSVRGHATDFILMKGDYDTLISLTYIDVSAERYRNDTAEDYLNITKEQLSNSQHRNYTFADGFEFKMIGDWEYTVMRTEFTYKENPAEIMYQDGCAYRFVNTMVVFIAVYSEEERISVDSFFASISAIQ